MTITIRLRRIKISISASSTAPERLMPHLSVREIPLTRVLRFCMFREHIPCTVFGKRLAQGTLITISVEAEQRWRQQEQKRFLNTAQEANLQVGTDITGRHVSGQWKQVANGSWSFTDA